MEEAKKVTATLKVVATGEFFDNESSEDTVRFFVEQYLEDSGFDVEVELLKEQEPLEPTMVRIEQAGPLYHRCYCKKCGHHVGNMINNKVADVHENFCSSCGQAVKWDERR